MSIIRLIHITIDPSETENAMRVWKTECAPLMIQQKGCISEKLLRCRDVHELISYSERGPKRILSSIVRPTRTRKSFGMHADSKVRRHK